MSTFFFALTALVVLGFGLRAYTKLVFRLGYSIGHEEGFDEGFDGGRLIGHDEGHACAAATMTEALRETLLLTEEDDGVGFDGAHSVQ